MQQRVTAEVANHCQEIGMGPSTPEYSECYLRLYPIVSGQTQAAAMNAGNSTTALGITLMQMSQ